MLMPFLQGALMMACLTAGLFFLRFWKTTRDRLFVFFALAFWVLGVQWAVFGVITTMTETRYYLYLPRLFAFVLIIAAIVDKNRSAR